MDVGGGPAASPASPSLGNVQAPSPKYFVLNQSPAYLEVQEVIFLGFIVGC